MQLFSCYAGSRRSEPIGELELLNVFIDNASLTPEIYENADMEALCEGLNSALKAANLCRKNQ